MKNLLEMLTASKEDLPDIYCDMDEVLVDFIAGANKVVGEPFVTADKDERWQKINQEKGFWANLNWKSGGKRLYQFKIKYDPYILYAASGRDPTSRLGKMKWLKKNTDFKRGRILIVKRSQKKNYAKTGDKPNILIDDYIKNINEWERSGGIGVHHTNVSKTISELKRLGFK